MDCGSLVKANTTLLCWYDNVWGYLFKNVDDFDIEQWTMKHHKLNDLPRPVGAPANDKQYKVQLSSRPSVTNRINFIAKRWFSNKDSSLSHQNFSLQAWRSRFFFIGQPLKFAKIKVFLLLWSRTINPIDIYFLIDNTQSMKVVKDKLAGIVTNIKKKIEETTEDYM